MFTSHSPLSHSPLSRARLLAGFGTVALVGAVCLVSSRPAHTAGGPIAVNVANTPLPTTATDDHDKQGVQCSTEIILYPGGSLGYDSQAYTVPAGKRLVIESFSAREEPGQGNGPAEDHTNILCQTQGGLNNSRTFTDFDIVPNGSPFPSGNVQVHQYADAGSSVYLEAYRAESDGSYYVIVNFTGYLVNIATPGGSS